MKKEFDFDRIGKKTPYRMPEGFFDEMQHNVLQYTGEKKRKSFSLPRVITFTLAAAAVLLGVLILPDRMMTDESSVLSDDALVLNTSWIDNMSDEDLAYMESIYECDIFMY